MPHRAAQAPLFGDSPPDADNPTTLPKAGPRRSRGQRVTSTKSDWTDDAQRRRGRRERAPRRASCAEGSGPSDSSAGCKFCAIRTAGRCQKHMWHLGHLARASGSHRPDSPRPRARTCRPRCRRTPKVSCGGTTEGHEDRWGKRNPLTDAQGVWHMRALGRRWAPAQGPKTALAVAPISGPTADTYQSEVRTLQSMPQRSASDVSGKRERAVCCRVPRRLLHPSVAGT